MKETAKIFSKWFQPQRLLEYSFFRLTVTRRLREHCKQAVCKDKDTVSAELGSRNFRSECLDKTR